MDTVRYASLDVRENRSRFRNEPGMGGLAECGNGATADDENIESTIVEVSGSRIQPERSPSKLHEIACLPPARMVKFFEVRYKLANGMYDLDERLDAVLERILTDINTQDRQWSTRSGRGKKALARQT